MIELQFCVDEQLCITSCCERLGDLQVGCKPILGQSYDQLLPRLCYEDHDALAWVLHTGEGLLLENVLLGERLPVLSGDLSIDPLQKDGIRAGVRVIVRASQNASVPPQLQFHKRSDELEKLAIMFSHGVRNPLNAIKGAVTYLNSRFNSDPELTEFTGIMIEEIGRLEQFIGGFLATSCFDQGAVLLDINVLLKKISVYTALQARVAGVDLILDYGPVRSLRANSFQVEQAILNLLNNAIAVLPQGGQVILRSDLRHRQEQTFVVLEVEDDGPGMPASKINALNDPTSEPERGRERGFGLYITREVIQSYGGLMEIDSEVGKGTLVRLLLPVADEGHAT